MLGFDVRHVVTSSTGRRVLFGAFEHTVVVNDLVERTISRSFETTFDFGGRRLALSDEVDGVLVGAYRIHGLALYSCRSGNELWRRKDIEKIQRIALSRDGLMANCGRQDASLIVIDMKDGTTVSTIKGANALHDSKYDPIKFIDGIKPQLLNDSGDRICLINRTTFAFLGVTFAPGFLVVSESGGPVRCFEITKGIERWRYQPKTGRHVIHLGYRESCNGLVGIEWPFKKGGRKQVINWSFENGVITESFDIGNPVDCSLALAGDVIVTSDGLVYDSKTGLERYAS